MAYKNKVEERQKKKAYYQRNKERIHKRTRPYGKIWYQKNRKRIQLSHREYYQKNKEKVQLYHKDWYQENKERLLRQSKEYYYKNKEKIRLRHRNYNSKNKEKILQYKRRWQKHKRSTDPRYRLDENMGTLIWHSLKYKKAKRHWETLTDYRLEELMKHLERGFEAKMNWDNYGTYWAVDHIIPRSLFNYTSSEDLEFKQCWSLENLQPLEKIKNIKKGNRYIG